MSLALRLVLYSFLLFICSPFLIAKLNYRHVFEARSEYSNNNYVFNNSEIGVIFRFDEESIVSFKDLKTRNTTFISKDVERNIQRINDVCEKYNLTEKLTRTHFLYSPKHKALYCWIRKVGSTSFTKFFGNLRNRRVARNYYREINFLAPQSIQELTMIINDRNVFKFLAVRHPFERIVSSYRDRIADNSRYTAQAWIYAPRIFHLTRPELFHSNGSSGNALRQIFNQHRRLKLIPTFVEFVTWLLKDIGEKDDVHWYQYHEHCSLCRTKFDYILKLDNYTVNDVEYIFSKLGLDANRTYLPKLQSSRGGSTDFTRTCEYFSSLSRDSVRKLYKRYRVDFEMFDYKYDEHLNCVKT